MTPLLLRHYHVTFAPIHFYPSTSTSTSIPLSLPLLLSLPLPLSLPFCYVSICNAVLSITILAIDS
jgi:hypothetical protein